MKRYSILIFVILISLSLMTSCKKDKGDPPVLPPAKSMTIDFSNFESGKKGDVSISIPKGTQNSNWAFAASAALLWNAIIYTTLAVPVYSFQLAIDQKAVYIDDRTWQWSADATVLNKTYTARLTGQITASNVVWKMYITLQGAGGYTDFLWFEGTSELDGTKGQWKLYESQLNPVEIVKVDWTVGGAGLGSVKYTFTKAGNAFANSSIEYGLTTGALNAYYTIYYYNAQYEQYFDMNVQWSTTLHNGKVKCLKFFGTSDYYCWDGNYLNVTCQ
jgi:hypothetical protein